MKWIDEKGRLFGKLNIIDAIVLLVVIFAVALVGMKVVKNHQAQKEQQAQQEQQSNEEEKEYWVIFTAKTTEIEPEVYEVVKRFVDAGNDKMDQMFTSDGLIDAYVIDVKAVPHVTYVECADGSVKAVESSGEDARLDLYFTAVANVRNFEINRIGGQEIRANIPYILKSTHFEFRDSVIQSVEWLESREDLSEVLNLDVLQAIRELEEEE